MIGWKALWLGITLYTAPLAQALSQFEILEVLTVLLDDFITPKNVEIAKTINSTLFAEEVKGTVDISGDFDGRELSTEYVFGIFVNLGQSLNEPAPLGLPISYNVTHLLIQHSTVAASIICEFEWPVLNQTFPIEIGAYFNINEQKQIQEYDLTFRRFGWAIDMVVPQLYPFMKEKLDLATNNDTQILQQYLAQTICNASLAACNGTNEHYASYDDCMGFLNTTPIGTFDRMGEDNLACRYLHTQMLRLRPSVHCPHVGRSGGTYCIPRDYTQVVLESHFPKGFLAPRYITPENKDVAQNIYVTNGTKLSHLLDISTNSFDLHSWDPTLFATCTFVFLLILYASSKVAFFLWHRFNRIFRLLRPSIQVNVVMYTMNIFYTSVALALELASTPVMASDYRLWMVQVLRVSGVIICGLYCFELIYRHDIRIQLVLHHVLTIFAIAFTVSVFEYTQSMTYMRSAIIWLFQATTEQSVFVGLIGYRLRWSPQFTSRMLKWSALQTLIIKSGSAIALIAYWGVEQDYKYRPIDQAWSAMVWIIGMCLLATQFWGSYAVYRISKRVAAGDLSALGAPDTILLPIPEKRHIPAGVPSASASNSGPFVPMALETTGSMVAKAEQ